MFKVNTDLSIEITRGDAVEFIVTAQENGENYVFKSGDIVRFKVFEKKGCDCVVLQKDFGVESDTEEVTIALGETDTKIGELIHKPKDYWYEVELNPDTLPYTIIGYDEDGAKVFKLYPEGRDLGADPITPEDIPFVDKELDMTSHNPVENQAIVKKFATVEENVSKNASNIQLHTTEINNIKNTNNIQNTSINDNATAIRNHANNKENPHGVTVAQIGAVPTSRTVNGKALTGNIALTASDVGARSNTWMPTASDVGAASAEYAKKVGAPYNLLDNSDFSQPVNQRGETSYTGKVYGPDRWVGLSADLTAKITTYTNTTKNTKTGVLVLSNASASSVGVYAQRIDPVKSEYMLGKTFTFAVCRLNGQIDVCSGVCEAADITDSTNKKMFSASCDGGLHSIAVYKVADTQCFTTRINIAANDSAWFKWMALYEGEYTAETLPAYQPKGYAAELMECRRYFHKLRLAVKNGLLTNAKTQLRFGIPLPVIMRIENPTVTELNISGIRTATGSNMTPTITGFTAQIYKDGWLDILATVEALSEATNNTPVAAYVGADISADL